MVRVEGWTLHMTHSADCASSTSEYAVVALAATEMHGLQAVCLTCDGAGLDLVEDVIGRCTGQCSARMLRRVKP